ncbi:putative protein kinase A binding protein [Trypoxylus dichotomus]
MDVDSEEFSGNERNDDLEDKSSAKIKIKRATFGNNSNERVSDSEESLVPQEPIPCSQFNGYEEAAKSFVDDILRLSAVTAQSKRVSYVSQEESSSSESAITFVEVFGSFTAWPTIEEFTVELGEDRIAEYISTWYYEEEWLYCVELRLQQSDGCCDYYIYETKWSLPTKEYPIAQATASIYFTIGVSRVKPRYCQVDVTYNYEGCRYVHVPFKHTFTEQWLFNIIEAKLKFFKTLRF